MPETPVFSSGTNDDMPKDDRQNDAGLKGSAPAPGGVDAQHEARLPDTAARDPFYHAFEAAFRGSREEIGGRLQVYLPFVRPWAALTGAPKLLDLGCGRGEWLELMTAEGYDVMGIDLDAGMLAECHARGLPVRQTDALGALRELPGDSRHVVSAFHLIEHLPFETMRDILTEALRVLVPGGLMILETPNAENLHVGTQTFHNDMTHVRPIPAPVLKFLGQYHGFARSVILRLNEPAHLAAGPVSLRDVIFGVSPDYALVAQKAAAPGAAILGHLDAPFGTELGLGLDELARRLDADAVRQQDLVQIRHEIDSGLARLRHEAQSRLHGLEGRVSRQHGALDGLSERMDELARRVARGSFSKRAARVLREKLRALRRFLKGGRGGPPTPPPPARAPDPGPVAAFMALSPREAQIHDRLRLALERAPERAPERRHADPEPGAGPVGSGPAQDQSPARILP